MDVHSVKIRCNYIENGFCALPIGKTTLIKMGVAGKIDF